VRESLYIEYLFCSLGGDRVIGSFIIWIPLKHCCPSVAGSVTFRDEMHEDLSSNGRNEFTSLDHVSCFRREHYGKEYWLSQKT
jgi:hypothetical protein